MDRKSGSDSSRVDGFGQLAAAAAAGHSTLMATTAQSRSVDVSVKKGEGSSCYSAAP